MEDQKSITEWAKNTFNDKITDLNTYKLKLEEETEEFLESNNPDELADIYIVLVQIANMLNCNLQELVDNKMKINRERKWEFNGEVFKHKEEKTIDDMDNLFSLEEENKILKKTVYFMNEQTRLQEEKIKNLENTLEFLRIQVENNFSDKYIKEKYNEIDLQKLWESAKTIMKWKAGNSF